MDGSAGIYFHCEDVSFSLDHQSETKEWLIKLLKSEGYSLGTINYIFCSDDFLLKINKEHLNHDYYTDVITFDYSQERVASCDVYVSIERVEDNSKALKNSYINELFRVLAHALLHVAGYTDKTQAEKDQIREKEDYYLSLRPF